MTDFLFQIACQTWHSLTPAEIAEFESNDFTFEDFLAELKLAASK